MQEGVIIFPDIAIHEASDITQYRRNCYEVNILPIAITQCHILQCNSDHTQLPLLSYFPIIGRNMIFSDFPVITVDKC